MSNTLPTYPASGGTPTDEDVGPHPSGKRASAPRVMVSPNDMINRGRLSLESWLRVLPSKLAEEERKKLAHRDDLSTRGIARYFRNLSATCWTQNAWYSLWNLSDNETQIPIQKMFNNQLMTYDGKGALNLIKSDAIIPLFPPGEPEKWPNLVLTSNHARAWQGSDLVEILEGQERMARDAFGKPLPMYRLTHAEQQPDVGGKTIMVLACHTQRDLLLNGADLIERRCELEEDPNRHSPEKRSIANMSPAAMRLAKLALKTMAEPESQPLIDLGRAHENFIKEPYIANELMRRGHEDVNYPDNHPIIIRSDAASIAQHIKGQGFSKGCNTMTDMMRFMWLEYKQLGPHMQIRDSDGQLRAMTDKDMQTIIGNMALLAVCPGEVPLTNEEKYTLGITRTSIHNKHDLTAGHLVNPDASEYDPWADKLIEIEGSREAMGHSVKCALGAMDRAGFIMDPIKGRTDPAYREAQDAVRAFYASCYQQHAMTTLCLSYNAAEQRNELYLQFAPGINRADEAKLERDVLREFHHAGFAKATISSDFSNHRRSRIILNGATTVDIGTDAEAIRRCQTALREFETAHSGELVIAREVDTSLTRMAKQASRPVLGSYSAVTVQNSVRAMGHRE